jgi:uncharacterized protein
MARWPLDRLLKLGAVPVVTAGRIQMTTGMTEADRTIDYEALAQDAMRGLVRTVLTKAAKLGLPGEHHFYISFDTLAPGAFISKRLREKYPDEMTIVLQHRFWDLAVTDERFEVKLTFDGIPERLVVPFNAIKVFFDPSVRFSLQFEGPEAAGESARGRSGNEDMIDSPQTGAASGGATPTALRAATTRTASERKVRTTAAARKSRDRGDDTPPPPAEATRPGPRLAKSDMSRVEPAKAEARVEKTVEKPAEKALAEADKSEAPAAAPPSTGAQVVQLDKFRKK